MDHDRLGILGDNIIFMFASIKLCFRVLFFKHFFYSFNFNTFPLNFRIAEEKIRIRKLLFDICLNLRNFKNIEIIHRCN